MNPESTGISTTVALTGVLPFVVLMAAALSLPLCFFLLWLYRRSVVKGMDASAGGQVVQPARVLQPTGPAAALSIRELSEAASEGGAVSGGAILRRAANGPWRTGAVYAIAGTAYAAVMTTGWLIATKDSALVWTKIALLFWTYFWPAVITVLLVAAYDRIRRMQLLAGYFGVLAVLIAVALTRNPQMRAVELPLYWLLTNGAETVLLMTFLLRPIRAVGPLVLVFLLVVALGSQTLLSIAAADQGLLRAIAQVGFALGLSGIGLFVALILLGIIVFAALGWPLLRWIGRRYERKKLSDQSITIDSIWLLFGIVQSIGLAFEGAAWMLTGLVAFAAYKLIAALGFRALRRARTPQPRTLLLLRVFRLGKRSERLFDKLRKHWQQVGCISMIAGPDLVTTTVEPHEFLEFVSGRLGRQFVAGSADLERRIAAMDTAPDPDGRYRVNEFFCRADTWQPTMQRLSDMSDMVLMDLRSFSPANQGCLFELGRLLDQVDLTRVVFLVDQTTDRRFLEGTLERLWDEQSAGSPNVKSPAPVARLFSIQSQSEREIGVLLRLALAPDQAHGLG
jgi:hypothetical protein